MPLTYHLRDNKTPGHSRYKYRYRYKYRHNYRSIVKRENIILWGIPLSITILAGILIASTQRQAEYVEWYHHWITGIIGTEIALYIARIPLERWKSMLAMIYGVTVISLIGVRFIGTSALGAQRWISIAGFHIQPSEFAKIAIILLVAGVLSERPPKCFADVLFPSGVIALPWLLVFIQPDLGTSLVFGVILLAMLFWSGMRLLWILVLFFPLISAILATTLPMILLAWIPISGSIVRNFLKLKRTGSIIVMIIQGVTATIAPYLWIYGLKDYQRERLLLFIDPNADPFGGGYHLLQSKVGVGSGGLFGTGLMHGELTKLQFIPEQHTDFIFSALGEETGFVGSVFLVTSFALFIWRLIQIAGNARTEFESLVVVGIAAMLMFEVFVNINMTIGLGPITGIPLPWMSYGRSAIIANFLSLGLCASVARRSQRSSNW
uniref:Uncharacterized protein n=1 Tax=Paulinella longichromatophora TaxID=1708747 RepID=A0A2H4ZPY8_9EUKA|nr:hypothetical protein PLO_606 [Paulinella longichromatophora]